MKKLYLLIFGLLFSINNLSAQEYASDKGAFILNGEASFSSAGGPLYEHPDQKRSTSIVFAPSIDYFLKRNIFVGSAFLYSRNKNHTETENIFGIGPEVGYVYGKPESKILPVISVGFLYIHQNSDLHVYDPYGGYSGYGGYAGYGGYGGYGGGYGYGFDPNNSTTGNELFISLGVIVPVHKHIGVTIGGIYRYQNYNPSGHKTSGNVIELCLGLNGLLY